MTIRHSAPARAWHIMLLSTVTFGCAGSAAAQTADLDAPQATSGDIIVTARKRSETSIAVPVTISAIGAEELSRRNITTMDALARAIPALIIGEGGSSGLQGGIVVIRGISGTETNPFSDQAVSFNIDGVQVAKSSVRRMGQMDMQQVEVLKGPQALYFGKNSPGGIISIRTGDPTSSFEAGGSIGYEFNAHETNSTAYVSGPITPTLGIRVAAMIDDMRGWIDRVAPRSGAIGNGVIFGPSTSHAPDTTDYAGRVTLKWEPSDRFDAKLKVTYGNVNGTAATAGLQVVRCALASGPQGLPANTPGVCAATGQASGGELGPNMAAMSPLFGNGNTYTKQWQVIGGLEMNYKLADELTLTSMSSLYKSKAQFVGNFNAQFLETGVGASRIIGNAYFGGIRELTEEVRMASSFSGPFNFTVGGLVQDTKNDSQVYTAGNALTPFFIGHPRFVQDGFAWSAFAQGQLKFLKYFELSAGGRYSRETKELPVALNEASFGTGLQNIYGPDYLRKKTWKNFSPEVMLSYRPTPDLNIYGGYKEGFLSGGFNANAVQPARNAAGAIVIGGPVAAGVRSDYDPQESKGWEAGIKASLLDGTLRTNLSFYTYKISGLQVGVSVNNNTAVIVGNAANVRQKGMEFDFHWRSPVQGLSFSGGVAYTNAKYLDYLAQCYTGQSPAQCFARPQLNGGTAQDLSGQQLARAPFWTGNLGFDYEKPVSEGLKLGISGNWTHSDSYWTDAINSPLSRHPNYTLFDATLRLAEADNGWELALIGRNLTDKHTYIRGSGVPFTGNATTIADFEAVVDRGRQIMLRLSFKMGH